MASQISVASRAAPSLPVLGQNDGELLAAETGYQVAGRATMSCAAFGHLFQAAIAFGVAVVVIEGFEQVTSIISSDSGV